MQSTKKYFSEFIGTLVLVFMGCGSAVFLGASAYGATMDVVAVALAFGFSIVAMAYVIGGISGCHINPAVSLSMLLSKKMGVGDFVGYVIAQVLGAIAGAAVLHVLLSVTGMTDATGSLGSNSIYNVGIAGGFIVEILLTFIFVFVILGVVSDSSKSSVAGIVIGFTLTFVHIVGIPLTGTSVNPARSIGPAIFAGGNYLSEVWVFILAPFIGSVLAVVVFKLLKVGKKI